MTDAASSSRCSAARRHRGPSRRVAQQPERMRRIGVLVPYAENDPEAKARFAAFLQGLQQSGWTDGGNVRIDARWTAGSADDTRKHAAELASSAPDVILTHGSSTVGPLLQVTRAVPIVFVVVPEPVGAGFRRKPSAAGWQRHRLRYLRIRHEREMAGAAQADRAGRDASGGHS